MFTSVSLLAVNVIVGHVVVLNFVHGDGLEAALNLAQGVELLQLLLAQVVDEASAN